MKIKDFLAQEKGIKVGQLVTLLILAVLMVICFEIAYRIERNKAVTYEKVLGYYHSTYLLEKSGNLSIISLDGGKNWYSYQKDSKGGIKILGQVKR